MEATAGSGVLRVRLLPDIIAQIDQALLAVLEEQAAVQLLVVSTLDGRKVTSHSRSQADAARIAALAATLLSMSAAAAKELGGQRATECIVMHDSGILCFNRLGPNARFVLAAAANVSLNLGMLVSIGRRLSQGVGQALERLLETGS